MAIDDKTRDEKLQYYINRKAAKISSLSSGKHEKNEYLTSEKILPSHQSIMIEQATVIYSLLQEAFENQIDTIQNENKKQIKQLKNTEWTI